MKRVVSFARDTKEAVEPPHDPRPGTYRALDLALPIEIAAVQESRVAVTSRKLMQNCTAGQNG
ncbi:uncharacterized protein ColSpa_11231 [Colletotrichum spaethianum]|uniref:Uncharacterized protein n=1 Tax=Colletotrichum spaethianum TaxID=700344 RepID=A0AA37PEY7_9PEZI|nr:uncharacterized protein ColSpa_11231 [Colletotrichum spaethianum]GKT51050.1 hypothetical protein ColSpa_11231 [Colletotrichum spaethianum]